MKLVQKLQFRVARGRWDRGMTLIELILVIGIIGIFAVGIIAVMDPVGQVKRSNDAKRKSDLAQLQRGLELYYQDKGAYPSSSPDFRVQTVSGNVTTTLDWGNSFAPYMNTLPKDPVLTHRYVYYSPPSSNGQTYYIYANLEKGTGDKQACNNGGACTSLGGSGFPTSSACGAVCNFGLSSSNVTP
jgi:general secretion pathway protein G